MPKSQGRIITFYSYKGGTGRTMLLANVAWVLASNGKRVLVVDWDLEAPGLHRYYGPFLIDRELTSSPGVIDMVTDYAVEAMTEVEGAEREDDFASADVLEFATSLTWKFPKPGGIDFVSAGRQGPTYAARVNSFNWQNFYDRLGGGAFLEAVKKNMRAEYDYVLIDSRTGVSDTAGVCTVQLPDTLVVCFTLNNQSIEGASAIAHSVVEQRLEEDFHIYPVPTRVEEGEKKKLEIARDYARSRFRPFLGHVDPSKIDQYWGHVEVPYKIFYAYEEILAAFGDRPEQPTSLLASAERLAGYLTGSEVTRLQPASEAERRRVLAEFERRRPRAEDPSVPSIPTPPAASPSAGLDEMRREQEARPSSPTTPASPKHADAPAPPTLNPATPMMDESTAIQSTTTGATASGTPISGAPTPPHPGITRPLVAAALATGLLAMTWIAISRFVAPTPLGLPSDASIGRSSDATPQTPSPPNRDEAILAAALAASDPLEQILLLQELSEQDPPAGAAAAAHKIAQGPLPIAVLLGHTREIVGALFSPDDLRVLTASLDGTVRVWPADGRGDAITLDPGEGTISSFDAARNLIAASTEDGNAALWSSPFKTDGEVFRFQRIRVQRSSIIRINREGSLVVRAFTFGEIHVWQSNQKDKNAVLNKIGFFKTAAPITGVNFTKTGKDLIVHTPNHVFIWSNLDNPKEHSKPSDSLNLGDFWPSRPDSSLVVAVSPDGDAIAAGDDGTLRAWRIKGGKFDKTPIVLKQLAGTTSALAVHDGACAAGSLEGKVQIWLWDQAEPQNLGSHDRAVRSIAFSPDKASVVTASDDGRARVLEVNGRGEMVLKNGSKLLGAAFSGDGAHVVTTAIDKSARVWRLRPDATSLPSEWPALLQHLRAVTSACLTTTQRLKLLPGESAADARQAYEKCELLNKRKPLP